MTKKLKPKYSAEQIAEFEQAANAEARGGPDIAETMLLQMMDAQADGSWGDTPYNPDVETEQHMLERICAGTSVVPAALKDFMTEGRAAVALDEGADTDEVDDYYYTPPKREMHIIAITPEDARKDADTLRGRLLNPDLSRYEREELANEIAGRVSAYHEIDERLEELTTPREFESAARSNADCLEHNALQALAMDRDATAHQVDSLNSTVRTLGLLHNGKALGRPIDMVAFKEGIQQQMDELILNVSSRQQRIAQFVISAQQAAENIMLTATTAPTAEARAMIIKTAITCFEKATKMIEKLDAMATPKAGRIIEPAEDAKITRRQSHKKLPKSKTG
jgi:hypothetical protein